MRASMNLVRSLGKGFFRYLPFVLIIVVLKLFILMVVFSSNTGDNYVSFNDYNPNIEDPLPEEVFSLQERLMLKEKRNVLDKLNDTMLVASNQNRTPHDSIWLFFNRIPRTGAHTIISLLKSLMEYNDFMHQEHIYRTPWQRLLMDKEMKNLASWYEYNVLPVSYDRLTPFVDFDKYRSKYVRTRPAYITLVRDPVEKFVSNFRFRRMDPETTKREMSRLERNKTGQGRKWYWRSINECVLEADPECNVVGGEQNFITSVPFLCGQHQQCLNFNDRWALQKAKFNAEFEYSVVGIVENWNQTLSVLEKFVPLFFKGALSKYWSEDFADHRQEKLNPKRYKPMSDEVRHKLKNLFSTEYELYEFLKQRLHRQYESISDLINSPVKLHQRKSTPRQLSPLDRFKIELRKSVN